MGGQGSVRRTWLRRGAACVSMSVVLCVYIIGRACLCLGRGTRLIPLSAGGRGHSMTCAAPAAPPAEPKPKSPSWPSGARQRGPGGDAGGRTAHVQTESDMLAEPKPACAWHPPLGRPPALGCGGPGSLWTGQGSGQAAGQAGLCVCPDRGSERLPPLPATCFEGEQPPGLPGSRVKYRPSLLLMLHTRVWALTQPPARINSA